MRRTAAVKIREVRSEGHLTRGTVSLCARVKTERRELILLLVWAYLCAVLMHELSRFTSTETLTPCDEPHDGVPRPGDNWVLTPRARGKTCYIC